MAGPIIVQDGVSEVDRLRFSNLRLWNDFRFTCLCHLVSLEGFRGSRLVVVRKSGFQRFYHRDPLSNYFHSSYLQRGHYDVRVVRFLNGRIRDFSIDLVHCLLQAHVRPFNANVGFPCLPLHRDLTRSARIIGGDLTRRDIKDGEKATSVNLNGRSHSVNEGRFRYFLVRFVAVRGPPYYYPFLCRDRIVPLVMYRDTVKVDLRDHFIFCYVVPIHVIDLVRRASVLIFAVNGNMDPTMIHRVASAARDRICQGNVIHVRPYGDNSNRNSSRVGPSYVASQAHVGHLIPVIRHRGPNPTVRFTLMGNYVVNDVTLLGKVLRCELQRSEVFFQLSFRIHRVRARSIRQVNVRLMGRPISASVRDVFFQ